MLLFSNAALFQPALQSDQCVRACSPSRPRKTKCLCSVLRCPCSPFSQNDTLRGAGFGRAQRAGRERGASEIQRGALSRHTCRFRHRLPPLSILAEEEAASEIEKQREKADRETEQKRKEREIVAEA